MRSLLPHGLLHVVTLNKDLHGRLNSWHNTGGEEAHATIVGLAGYPQAAEKVPPGDGAGNTP